jgi:hypothetical protein
MSNERDNLGSTKMVSRTRRISPARVASRVAKAVNAKAAKNRLVAMEGLAQAPA